jgi:hypothetical protein
MKIYRRDNSEVEVLDEHAERILAQFPDVYRRDSKSIEKAYDIPNSEDLDKMPVEQLVGIAKELGIPVRSTMKKETYIERILLCAEELNKPSESFNTEEAPVQEAATAVAGQ